MIFKKFRSVNNFLNLSVKFQIYFSLLFLEFILINITIKIEFIALILIKKYLNINITQSLIKLIKILFKLIRFFFTNFKM